MRIYKTSAPGEHGLSEAIGDYSTDRPRETVATVSNVPAGGALPSASITPVIVNPQSNASSSGAPSWLVYGGCAVAAFLLLRSRDGMPNQDKLHNRVLDSVTKDVRDTTSDVQTKLLESGGNMSLVFKQFKADDVPASVAARLEQMELRAESVASDANQLRATFVSRVLLEQAIAYSICIKHHLSKDIVELVDKTYERQILFVESATRDFLKFIVDLYNHDGSVVKNCASGVFIPKLISNTTTTDHRSTSGTKVDVVCGILGSGSSSTTIHDTTVSSYVEKTLTFQCTTTRVDLTWAILKQSEKAQTYTRALQIYMSSMEKVVGAEELLSRFLT